MATRNSDVNLVIRARDEATKGIEAVTASLNNLFGSQEKVAGSASKTGSALTQALAGFASLDKGVAAITAATDRAESGFKRLNTSLDENRNKLESLKSQYASAQAVVDRLSSQASKSFVGPRTEDFVRSFEPATAAAAALGREIQKTSSVIARQEAEISTTRSSLQQLASIEIAAKDARVTATAAIELETQALARQGAEADRVTAIQARINAATGVNRTALFDGSQASQSAAILATADALYRETEARDQHVRKLREEEAAATAAAVALERRTKFDRFTGVSAPSKSARDSAAVFQEEDARVARELADATRDAVNAEKQLDDAAAGLRARLNPLAPLQETFNKRLREATLLYQQGKISAAELSQAQAKLAQDLKRGEADMRRNGREGIGVFGLRPYEVTNLGYQINDLVTQVSSGTSITQAFAQQGGQILQLFPKISAGIVSAFTSVPIIAFVSALAGVALGLKEIGDRTDRIREFGGALTAMGDGANYSAAALEKNVEAAKRYGIGTADATAALKTFVSEGLAPERLTQFTKTALDMSDVLGIKVPEAAKQLADAFTGGYDAIAKLDDATNAFTASEREHIRALFEEGKAQEARAYAYDIFADRQRKGAEEARGPWANAVRALGTAWQSFMDVLANSTVLQTTAKVLETIANGVTNVLNRLTGSTDQLEKLKQINDLSFRISAAEKLLAEDNSPNRNARAQGIEDLRKKLAVLQKEAGEAAKALGTVTGDTVSGSDNSATAKTRADRLAEIERERQQDSQKKLAGARRVAQAGELAFQAEIRRSGDAVIANAERALAVSREQAKVDAEAAKLAEQRLREGATSAGASKNLIMEREGFIPKARWDVNAYRVGYGSSTVTNPDGSTSKVTAKTTTTMEAALVNLEGRIKEFQDVIKRQIGTDRFGAFSPQQQASLTSVAYNYGSLPKSLVGPAKSGTQDDITAAIRALGGDNKGINRARRNREADLFSAAPNQELVQFNQDAAAKRLKDQQDFNQSIDDENARRRQSADILRIDGELTGNKLLDAQRLRAVEDAALKAQQEAEKKGLEISAARLQTIRETVAAEFDARTQQQRRNNTVQEAEKPVSDLVSRRKSLQDQLDIAQKTGDVNLAGSLEEQISGVNDALQIAIDKAIAFWQAMGGPESEAAIAKLQGIKATVGETGTQFLMTGKQINQTIAGGLANAFDRFAQNVAEGKNVFTSLKDAFLQFAADFLRQIAIMIIQQAIFNALGGGGSGGGGAGGALSSIIGGLFHNGGVVGQGGGQMRQMNPAWFTNALRYHTGGVVGLQPDEQAAVLRKGEEVLTANDPRHRNNGGAGGGGGAVKIVNVFDSAAAIEEALRTPAGEKALLNHVSDNSQAWRAAMGM